MDHDWDRLQDDIADWLKEYLVGSGADGFVLGVSGGLDSAVTAALAVRAVGAHSVLAAILPCHSEPIDARLAQQVIDALSMPSVTVSLDDAFDALMENLPPTGHRLAAANTKPRLRMTALYYLAQTHNYLVLGSGNKSELLVGYSTKHGDAGVDLLPLGDLYKTEVRQLARELDMPEQVVERAPSAGLWPGQTDEEELGITYDRLDRALEAIISGETADGSTPLGSTPLGSTPLGSTPLGSAPLTTGTTGTTGTEGIDPLTLEKVKVMMMTSAHKRRMPPIFRRPQG